MRGAASILFALGLAGGAAAQAPDLVIASAKEGGHYQAMAERLQRTLRRAGHHAVIQPTQGSVENLVQLEDPESPVGLVFAQSDALHGYLEIHPEFAAAATVLADVGSECVFLFARRDGRVATLADLKTAGRTLAVDQVGSGATVTWDTMQRIEPTLGETEAVPLDVMEALAQMRAGAEYARVDAAMVVLRPGTVSPPVKAVLENRETFRFVPIRAGDLRAASLPDGEPAYTFETARVRDVEVETLCTRALVIVNPEKVPPALRSEISRILLESRDTLEPLAE